MTDIALIIIVLSLVILSIVFLLAAAIKLLKAACEFVHDVITKWP